MMMQEFEARTGFYPSQELYQAIEAAYMDSDLDKDDFCKAYKQNKNGMAEAISRRVNISSIVTDKETAKTVSDLENEVERLKAQLEKEQEWKPYEGNHNVSQADYERLATSASGTRILTDEEAKDLIAGEFGFDRSKITILHSIGKEEINRHRQIRIAGEAERLPLYNATDWNYIRFDCACWYYEMYNGQLRQFYC